MQVTDPEVLMLVEARRDAHGKAAWEFAFWARRIHRGEGLTQGARGLERAFDPAGSGLKVLDPAEPYIEIVFQPGQGLNPTGAADPSRPSR